MPELQARLFAAIAARPPQGMVAAFSHKFLIALFNIHYQGHPPEQIWSLLLVNGAWEILEVDSVDLPPGASQG